jgi:nuclear pore complex protein Nup53
MMNDVPPDSSQSRFQPRVSLAAAFPAAGELTPLQNVFASPAHRSLVPPRPQSAPLQQSALPPQTPRLVQGPDSQPLYVIVFGYPPDKYTATLEYLKSLGGENETTDATPHSQITNCFRLGFRNPGDALRAVRKNGEVIGGSWMIGVKWAVSHIYPHVPLRPLMCDQDPQLAEATLGSSLTRGGIFNFGSPTPGDLQVDTTVPMSIDDGFPATVTSPSSGGFSNAPAFGTPIKLAPAGAAFRRAGAPSVRNTPTDPTKTQPQNSLPPANKGVLGQVSEMIFGW